MEKYHQFMNIRLQFASAYFEKGFPYVFSYFFTGPKEAF